MHYCTSTDILLFIVMMVLITVAVAVAAAALFIRFDKNRQEIETK